jgi:hypothetical protein
MNADAWEAFHRRWSRLKPPLRAAPEVVAAISCAIDGFDSDVLLLGVTPELANLGRQLTALDWSESMIGHIWPGDGPDRTAMLADWRAIPDAGRKFTAVIGDGSFNCLTLPDVTVVFGQLAKVLARPARLAVRAYVTPSPCESLADVRRAAMAGEAGGFHGFKWRLAMALAAEAGSAEVAVADVHARFEALFPDRAALAAAAGWSVETIAEIDAYAGSDAVYIFPTEAELLAAIPPVFSKPRLAYSGPYDLAERCPILVADFAP